MRDYRLLDFLASIYRLPRVVILCALLDVRNRISHAHLTSSDGPVVSLTSHSKRLRTVYMTIESIAKGDQRPSQLILWLDRSCSALPPSLRRLERRGLEVRLCEDWGPHKKYYPYSVEFFNDPRVLVTADDDVIYPRWWLQGLVAANAKCPDSIWCYRARVIAFDPDGSRLSPYRYWVKSRTSQPSFRRVPTGVSGVAYPPGFIRLMKDAGPDFMHYCSRADDIWLHRHSLLFGYRVGQVLNLPVEFPSIPGSQRHSLRKGNVRGTGNDVAVAATYNHRELDILRNEDPDPSPRSGSSGMSGDSPLR
jgi:hypothetical protein